MKMRTFILSLFITSSILFAGCGPQAILSESDNGSSSFNESSVRESSTESISVPVPSPDLAPDSNTPSTPAIAPEQSPKIPATSPEPIQKGDIRYIVRVDMSAYLRKEANDSVADENIITYIPVLTKVRLLRQEGDFSLVEYNDMQGYVKNEFLAATPFDNTYWWWARGVTNGTQYIMATYDDGSFYAVTMNGSEEFGTYQFDGEYLIIADEKYRLADGKYETINAVQAQSTYIYANLKPITEDDFESQLMAATSPAQAATTGSSDTQQSAEAYETWTITKHNTGIFDDYREETYTLEWEPGIVHALLTKWDVSDDQFLMLISYDVDFDAHTVDMCMDHFEGDAGYTKLVIDLTKNESYGTDYYDSVTHTYS